MNILRECYESVVAAFAIALLVVWGNAPNLDWLDE
jgi:hypothetical protein